MHDATPRESGKSPAARGSAVPGALAILGVAVAVMGLWLGVHQRGVLRLARDVSAFDMVAAEVLEVGSRPAGARFAQYEPRVRYSYEAGSARARYQSDVYSATPPRFDTRGEAEAFAVEAGYRAGRRLVAYVDPSDATRVVLTNEVSPGRVTLERVLLFLSVLLIGSGVGLVASAGVGRFRARSACRRASARLLRP